MAKTIRRAETEQFKRELSEAMSISPTRRAQEEREALRQVRDYLLETQDDGIDSVFMDVMGGVVSFVPHNVSDEYATE